MASFVAGIIMLLGSVAFLGLIIVLLALLHGWMLSLLWGWFIVPVFGLPGLTLKQALGVSLVVGLFRGIPHVKDGETNSYITTQMIALVYTLAFAWVLHEWLM